MKSLTLLGLSFPLLALAGGPVVSGLKTGEAISAFHPTHLSGPLAKSTNCFPCTFQNRPQVQAWIHGDDPANVGAIAKVLDTAMESHKNKEFKALIVVLYTPAEKASAEALAKSIPTKFGANRVGVALLPTTSSAVADYKINLDAKNTIVAYKNWKVTKNWTNALAKTDAAGLNAEIARISG
ncbi:MAG: hypothetical protein C4320_03205 [Armatimonadota bacterium]